MMFAGVDTNILLYAADSTGNQTKHRTAVALLNRLSAAGRGLLALQSLAEFYAAATRKRITPSDRATLYAEIWSDVFPVHQAGFADVADAMRVHREHGIPFWDAMVWSVTRRAGARFLITEDFQGGRDLEGVRFINPFVPASLALLDEALGL